MTETQPTYKTQWPSLTAVLHGMVKSRPGGLDVTAIAEAVGKPYNTLMSELGRQPGHKLDADLVLPLLKVTESDIPMHFLARQVGGSFVPFPSLEPSADTVLSGLAASARAFGEFMGEAALCAAGGKISQDRLAVVDKKGHEAVEAILAVMSLVRGAAGQQAQGK